MKKRITTLGLFAFLGATSLAYGQTEKTKGGVAINHESPKATLDIQAYNSDDNDASPEGILIPRISKKKAEAIGGNATESTLIYIKDNTSGTSTTYTSEVDAKGFYYMDVQGTSPSAVKKWKKVGGGTSTGGGTKQNWEDIKYGTSGKYIMTKNTETTPVPKDTWLIIGKGSNSKVLLPKLDANDAGKMIVVSKIGAGNLTVADYQGKVQDEPNSVMSCFSRISANRGKTFIWDGTQWLTTNY